MQKHFDYEIIGETQDDAVGEAFDKVARILGLGYPGGPIVSQRATQVKQLPGYQVTREEKKENLKSQISTQKIPTSNFPANSAGRQFQTSNPSSLSPITYRTPRTSSFFRGHLSPISLPRPMLNSPDFNFSFSGLKTAVLYAVQKFRKENALDESAPLPDEFVNAVCAEFQQASIDVLVKKTIKSAQKYAARTVILAGGVSANTELRIQMGNAVSQFVPSAVYHLSPIALSTDNAAMIASAGAFRLAKMSPEEQEKTKENWRTLETRADLTLASR
jgi:N6-L-threonylcarbamoyladenine synthase